MALDPVDEVLARAVSTPSDDRGLDHWVDLDELADRAGLPPAVVEAVAREGLLHPDESVDPPRYAASDADVLRAGTTLLESGLPLGELLDLARRADEDLRRLADHAVDVFLRFVRDPVRGTTDDDAEAADRLVTAFEQMLPAAGELVGAHFRRLLVDRARARAEHHE